MVRPILKSTDPRLREKSKRVEKTDKKVVALITDLKDTLKVQNDPEGVGLAAPQIGKNVRIFIFTKGKEMVTIINPEIIKISESIKKKPKKADKKTKIMEGCLSLPHFYGPLKRKDKITISYLDEGGKQKTDTFIDFDAQIVQHEIDHLNGILFVDRLLEQKKPLYEYVNGGWEKVEI